MKINKLRLRGFIGIKKGLGIDEIEIDFSDLSGLTALFGPNGSAKTTVLDCMHPYRMMASRKGALQHHVFLHDSEKEYSFEYEGDQYETLIKIDAESERQEGYVYKNGDTKSLVDEKVNQYDKLIIDMLGSSTLFFNSEFCAQDSTKFNKMTTGKLKELFSEFLRLDKQIGYENTSKQCANLLTVQAEKLEREIKALKELADIYGETTAKLQDAKTDKQRHEQSLAELANDLKQAETKLADIQALIQKNEVIRIQITALQDSLDRIEKEIKTDQEQSETELADLRSKYRTIDLEIVSLESLLANGIEIREAANRWAELTVVNGKRTDLLKIVTKDHFATAQERSKKETEKSTRSLAHEKLLGSVGNNRDRLMLEIEHAASQELSEKEAKRSEYKLSMGKRIGAGENNRDTLELKLDHAKLKIADLDKRDPSCESTICSFITGALSAKDDIPKLESKLSNQNADIKILKKEHSGTLNRINAAIEALREQKAGKSLIETQLAQELAIEVASIADMKKAYADILNRINVEIEVLKWAESEKKSEKDQLEAKITQSEDELTKIKPLADELPQVDTALTRKNDLGKRRTELTNEGIKIKATWKKRIAEKDNQKQRSETAIKEAETKINKKAEDSLSVVSLNIDLTKNSIANRTNEITDLSGIILSLEKEVFQKERAKKDCEIKAKEHERIINESSEWTYLKNACGKDGLRALEIDSVAPVITGYANDLLLSTFGPSYTVKFRTQDEETGREIFDILVIRDDGSEVLLDNLSGGQKVWGLKALRLAMTLIAKEKSGKNFLTALSDEEDGPLDVENAQNFIKLYRAFMTSGEFNDCFFISHKPECVAMADHVIKFGDGGITID